MNLEQLKQDVKQVSFDSGAALVGVGSRERLEGTPPSGILFTTCQRLHGLGCLCADHQNMIHRALFHHLIDRWHLPHEL